MRRKVMNEEDVIIENISLDDLIQRYALNKQELDSYKKLVENDNKTIKDIMLKEGKKVAVSGDFEASCTISNRVSVDEEKLLDVIKASGFTNLIRTKEYVDSDLLENAVYHGEIDKATLEKIAECNKSTEVVTLKVKRLK